MTKQVRWKCANCDHGLLAPTKPRKNDVRRYCLPCSAKTGKLVERVSPTLEKQRTVKSEQRKVKVKQLNDKKKDSVICAGMGRFKFVFNFFQRSLCFLFSGHFSNIFYTNELANELHSFNVSLNHR